MNSSSTNLEREALEEIERRLTAQGYTVLREPHGADHPPFFGNFVPDAVAVGKSPKLLIEVLTRRGSAEVEATKIKQLRAMLEGHDDWRLEVVYATPVNASPSVATAIQLRTRFEEIKMLGPLDRPSALIMAWSLLEAACRVAMPERAARPLTPATAVEFLTSLGYIVQSEADTLRRAGRARNLIVHGDLHEEVPTLLLDQVFEIIDSLIRHLERQVGEPD